MPGAAIGHLQSMPNALRNLFRLARAGLVFANGTLYIPTDHYLYAIRTPK